MTGYEANRTAEALPTDRLHSRNRYILKPLLQANQSDGMSALT